MRAAMKNLVLWLLAAISVAAIKATLHPFTTGYLPKISERGAIKSGPTASPSSQMVTRSVLVEELRDVLGSRSETMLLAMGTTAIHVNVL